LLTPPRAKSERGFNPWSRGRGRPGVADNGPAMNSWNEKLDVGWWRINSAWCTSAAMNTTFLTARSRNARTMRSRSKAKPVVLSSGTPKTLALDQESWAVGGPVGTESGTLETITFQVADDAVTPSRSQRRCTSPSMVLPGPSGSRFELRY